MAESSSEQCSRITPRRWAGKGHLDSTDMGIGSIRAPAALVTLFSNCLIGKTLHFFRMGNLVASIT